MSEDVALKTIYSQLEVMSRDRQGPPDRRGPLEVNYTIPAIPYRILGPNSKRTATALASAPATNPENAGAKRTGQARL